VKWNLTALTSQIVPYCAWKWRNGELFVVYKHNLIHEHTPWKCRPSPNNVHSACWTYGDVTDFGIPWEESLEGLKRKCSSRKSLFS